MHGSTSRAVQGILDSCNYVRVVVVPVWLACLINKCNSLHSAAQRGDTGYLGEIDSREARSTISRATFSVREHRDRSGNRWAFLFLQARFVWQKKTRYYLPCQRIVMKIHSTLRKTLHCLQWSCISCKIIQQSNNSANHEDGISHCVNNNIFCLLVL